MSSIKDNSHTNNYGNRILIITGGNVNEDFLRDRVQKGNYDRIIAADRGLVASDRLMLGIDFIVGDFDSVTDSVLRKYQELSTPIKLFPKEKDKTDTQIAIELALMHNPLSIDLIGATGSRLDHVIANIHMLMLPMQLNVEASILDANNKIYLRNKSFRLLRADCFGDYISLLPFTDKVNGLTLKGFKYPLDNIRLEMGTSLGISNEIISEEATVELNDGILLVIESRD